MKTKSIIVSLFLLTFTFVGFAQDNSTTSTPEKKKLKIWYGPRFGLDLSHFTTNPSEIQEQLGSNYQAGVMLQLGEKLYFQPEAYYASYKTSPIATDQRTNFIKTPLLVGARLLDLALVSVHIMGGPQFIFQLDNNDVVKGTKTMNWQVGAGADILGFITADLRYTLIPGQNIATQVSNFSLNSTGLNLTVGLKFR